MATKTRPGHFLFALSLLLGSGCASITTESVQTFSLTSQPSEATCDIKGTKSFATQVTTPNAFPVQKGQGDLFVTCTKEELLGRGVIKEEFAGMTLGNILFGGLIGVAVDAGTGKMWKYPVGGHVVLYPKDQQPAELQIIPTEGKVEEAPPAGKP